MLDDVLKLWPVIILVLGHWLSNTRASGRIEQKLVDHEQRIGRLEQFHDRHHIQLE